ncbi:hypothetical protein Slin15195_G073210 [Septoria linicola]|uniref:Uncharacterized protein n=1 Tax=Septoria linicola TaxID=215465 RepID=A0A9Q9EL51_9PEZI|nr:hypothetical protein Slin15195_G073210 [Septoria linicola]
MGILSWLAAQWTLVTQPADVTAAQQSTTGAIKRKALDMGSEHSMSKRAKVNDTNCDQYISSNSLAAPREDEEVSFETATTFNDSEETELSQPWMEQDGSKDYGMDRRGQQVDARYRRMCARGVADATVSLRAMEEWMKLLELCKASDSGGEEKARGNSAEGESQRGKKRKRRSGKAGKESKRVKETSSSSGRLAKKSRTEGQRRLETIWRDGE